MDWATFHRLAEEFSLWSTVAINLWLTSGATIFAISFIWKRSAPFLHHLDRAVRGSFLVLFTAMNGLGFFFCFFWVSQGKLGAAQFSGEVFLIIAAVAWEILAFWVWWRTLRGARPSG